MKVLAMFEYPPVPAGLSTQGDLLYRGLKNIGVNVQPVHIESNLEKEWYYRHFAPDVALGVGFWGYTPNLILHPQQFGVQPVPWLVADGYIADYKEVLNDLPLILVTSSWVKEVYVRDGIRPEIIEVLPVGCDTELFIPRTKDDAKVRAIRETFGVADDELMILTVGGDTASKGSREVMRALAKIVHQAPKWKYVCKTWPQPRTEEQNALDIQLAESLGIKDKVVYASSQVSRGYMPYLLAACDIYAGPSRLEGFGMPHVEAGACGKPVIAINAMAFLDTLVHGRTAFLAGVARENRINETVLSDSPGLQAGRRIIFEQPRIADYRADVDDIAGYMSCLMLDADLRKRMGEAGRAHAIANLNYRVVAKKFIDIVAKRLHGTASKTIVYSVPVPQAEESRSPAAVSASQTFEQERKVA